MYWQKYVNIIIDEYFHNRFKSTILQSVLIFLEVFNLISPAFLDEFSLVLLFLVAPSFNLHLLPYPPPAQPLHSRHRMVYHFIYSWEAIDGASTARGGWFWNYLKYQSTSRKKNFKLYLERRVEVGQQQLGGDDYIRQPSLHMALMARIIGWNTSTDLPWLSAAKKTFRKTLFSNTGCS